MSFGVQPDLSVVEQDELLLQAPKFTERGKEWTEQSWALWCAVNTELSKDRKTPVHFLSQVFRAIWKVHNCVRQWSFIPKFNFFGMHWIIQELFYQNNVNLDPYIPWLLSDFDLVGGKFEGFPNFAKYLYVHAMYYVKCIWSKFEIVFHL